nr:T9SS type A sorting domain-containing protein [Flavobacterium sp.]
GNWAITSLTGVTLQPGQYYLVQGASEAAVGIALPTPDVIGTLTLSATNGKVLLANVTTAQNGANPTGSQIIDKVGYGSANGYETTAMVELSNTKSGQRLNTGCTDTNNNSTDFTRATPAPRNSSTAVNTCVLSVKQNEISGLNVYPNPVKNGTLYISSDSASAKSVEIYDILGKQVLNAKTSNNAVNVSSLTSGSYIVKITEEGKTDTKKLIIQ